MLWIKLIHINNTAVYIIISSLATHVPFHRFYSMYLYVQCSIKGIYFTDHVITYTRCDLS